jgi:hypothetical protein
MHVIQAEEVGEEAGVETGLLQQLGDAAVARGGKDVVQRGFRMPLAADMHRRRPGLEIGDEMHLALRHGRSPAAATGRSHAMGGSLARGGPSDPSTAQGSSAPASCGKVVATT